MKRVLSILLCICMCASMLFINEMNVYAAGSVTITSPDAKDYDSGNTLNFRWDGNASSYHINLAKKIR